MKQHDGTGGLGVGPHAVFALDANGDCTLSTGPALTHLDLHPGELVGTNLFELYRDDTINVDALRRVLAGESFSLEREFYGRHLSTYFEPVRDVDGSVTGALGVTTDITEQRRTENELRAARERASLLAHVSEALSRELLDPETLLRTAVRAVTDAVADVGLVWVRGLGEASLSPMAAWASGGDPTRPAHGPASGVELSPLEASVVEAMSEPVLMSLDAAAAAGFSSLAKRYGAVTGLRVPLRSRGTVLGVIDVARGAEAQPFTEAEIDLVAEVSERCALALDHALLLRAHQEAREELVKFQALADASEDLIAITDTEDRTVYINPRVHASGVPLTGSVWKTAAVADIDESVQKSMRHDLETAGRWSGDVTVSTPDASLTARVSVFRLFHPDTARPLGTAWIGQDVTELRETERALREANSDLEQFKALVDASPDFIAIADMQGRVQYLNPGGRELVGLQPEVDVATSTIADYATAEGLVNFRNDVMPAVLAHGHWEGETKLRNHRGGPSIPVATSTFLVHDVESREPFAIATVQRDITERLAAETALRQLAEQRQALLTRLVDAQEAERVRIAADVHDDPVQACAAVDLRLSLFRRRVRERAPDLLDGLDALQATVSGATDRLRALLFDLEPPDLGNGLTGALSRAAREIFENTGIRWTVNGDEEPEVPDTTRAIAYRIAKEAMINARKHAEARSVVIAVAAREGGLQVSVDDDGIGLGPDAVEPSPGHRGLLSMQDRATVAGGRCTIRNPEGAGTVVTAWLPGPLPSDTSAT